MAKVSFTNIFISSAANQLEESNNFTGTRIENATSISFTSQDPNQVNFSGNNVPGNLVYTDANDTTVTIPGIVSRLFKSGSTYEGFYFVASGNDYALGSQEQTTAYILVWPGRSSAFADQDAGTIGVQGTYGTSSDPVDAGLNSLLNTQPKISSLTITEADADDIINVGGTVAYTFTFSSDIDATTFTSADIINTGTSTISVGTITEPSPGVFTFNVTGITAGTIQLAIPQGAVIVAAGSNPYTVNTQSQITDDSVITVIDPNQLSVSSISVNEGSSYAVFTVTGVQNDVLTLSLATGTAGAQDFASGAFDVSLDGGTTWTAYSAPVTLTGTTALVRTAIVNDSISDNNETFTLTASRTGGTATGTATIKDDGTGNIYTASGAIDGSATKNDDRPITISSPSVNEASPYAVFEVSGYAGQQIGLTLATGTATSADFGSTSFDVSLDGGATWTPYSAAITLTGSSALVRTAITNDNTPDNGETFTLTGAVVGGVTATGTATILDNGTGTIFNPDGTIDNTTAKDNDNPPPPPPPPPPPGAAVSSQIVNEASPYAVFNVQTVTGLALSLQLSAGTATGDDFNIQSFDVSLDGGKTWTPYTGPIVPPSGTVLVRTAIVNDILSDNNETFTLSATPNGGVTGRGTTTIRDDGTGSIYNPDGSLNTTAVKNDDRPVTVSAPIVNEGSPYGVFTVSGTPGQQLSLALATGTAGAADFGSSAFEVSLDGGATWAAYSGPITLVGATALVRTTIVNDAIADNNEKFTLTATAVGGNPAVGTATIVDDGSGTIFNADGTENLTAVKNDDRPVSVSSPSVNEGSPYGVFTVGGTAGQKLNLSLATGTAGAADFGSTAFDVSLDGGKTWFPYIGTLTLTGPTALVRTTIVNDTIADNNETFTLTATPVGGVASVGTATIKDDGTGTIFNPDGTDNPAAAKNDDRTVVVSSPSVNEATPYAVFTITGAAGQTLDLALANGSATTADYRAAFDVSLDGGKTWAPYAGGVTLVAPTALVRVGIVNDNFPDNGETFNLTATPRGGVLASGMATISDNGTGVIFNLDGTENPAAQKNDDSIKPVYSVLLANGDRYYTKDATDAAKMALGTGNVFEGARFDNLNASQGGVHRDAYYQAITKDWYFATSLSSTPYACYTLQPSKTGFEVASGGTAGAADFRMYINSSGITQILTSAEATALGLTSQGYTDKGVVFSSTTKSAFAFDPEAYLVMNRDNSEIQNFVKGLSKSYTTTSSKDFVEAVEQHFLIFGVANGLGHGLSATAIDLNAAFGTTFLG